MLMGELGSAKQSKASLHPPTPYRCSSMRRHPASQEGPSWLPHTALKFAAEAWGYAARSSQPWGGGQAARDVTQEWLQRQEEEEKRFIMSMLASK